MRLLQPVPPILALGAQAVRYQARRFESLSRNQDTWHMATSSNAAFGKEFPPISAMWSSMLTSICRRQQNLVPKISNNPPPKVESYFFPLKCDEPKQNSDSG
eukprot:scaffold821_cov122-Cylindrotheca_fusiformis.AAC.1